MIFIRTISIIIGLLILPTFSYAKDLELPNGWRPLQLLELKGTDDYIFRDSKDDLLNVTEDFDGDGRKDMARFLVKNDGKEYALFITHYNGNKIVHQKFYATQKLQEIARLGIQLAEPAEYITACGKGYWDCSVSEPPKITLRRPGIDFFMFESAGSIIYWDSSKGRFEEISTSD